MIFHGGPPSKTMILIAFLKVFLAFQVLEINCHCLEHTYIENYTTRAYIETHTAAGAEIFKDEAPQLSFY